MQTALLAAALLLSPPAAPLAAPPPAADLVLSGGRIVTLDPARPEAEALAVAGGRVLATGSAAEIAPRIGTATRVVDLAGRLAIPGFVDSHAHLHGLGRAHLQLALASAQSWEEIVARVAEAAAATPEGEWILGRGWHQEKWSAPPSPAVEGFPVHAALSRASPKHPVLLVHASGHAGFANALALARAGIDAATPDPPGGEILRDAAGNPTGLLRESAEELVQRAIAADRAKRGPAAVEAEELRVFELAQAELLAHGITTFHDAGASFATVDRLRRYADEGRLKVRLWVMLDEPNERLAAEAGKYRLVGYGGGRLTVRAIKRWLDGALGSRGAWLLAPYSDLPTSTGLVTYPLADLAETARIAAAHDLQLCVHAIGDRANREALDLYEATFAAHPERRDWRWRIEHAQHLDPADIPRFAQLGVIAAMQGIHATSDAPFVEPRLGAARTKAGAYAWRALLDSGAIIANGTDAPVEPVDPLASFRASVTRRTADGSVFLPEQRMTRLEALRSYTWAGAYAGFEEEEKGSLAPGRLADIAVLSRDILAVPEEEIRTAEVDLTIVGGEVVYERRHRAGTPRTGATEARSARSE